PGGHVFNHAILCIPQKNDTIWLECTSKDLPTNFLSSFTEDRYALMITPNGGVLVKTPLYDTSSNTISCHAVATINNMELSIVMDNIYQNEPATNVYYSINNKQESDIKQYVSDKFRLPGYTVNKYNF